MAMAEVTAVNGAAVDEVPARNARPVQAGRSPRSDEQGPMIERTSTLTDRQKAIEIAVAAIEKKYGKGTIMRLDDSTPRLAVEVIPTGSIALDLALGVGGVPRGRVIEIYGPESSGKTTLAYHIMAEAQRMGGMAAFIDAEHAFDEQWARNCGVRTDALLISQPDSGEQALEVAEMLVRSGAIDVVVIDSVAALVPRAEIDGEMGDAHVGLQARLMSQALRKLTAAISKSHAVVIFINQLREKIGIMFGNPETTPGGRALKFYSSVRLEIRRVDQIKNGTEVIGARTKVKVVKNKVAPPFRTCEFDLMFQGGISKEGGLLDVGVDMGIIRKSGAHFTYGETKLGMGRENAKEFLRQNPHIAAQIESEIRAHASQYQGTVVSAADD